jgi:hypothetical protein
VNILLSFITTLIIIFVVPIIVYGIFSKIWDFKPPEKKLNFFISVLIQKVGTGIGFVWLYYLGIEVYIDNWFIYSLIWLLMYFVIELGQSMITNYTKKEALAGIISELIYFPLSAFVLSKLLE